MHVNNYPNTKLPLLFVFGIAMVLTSCGTYQYAGIDNDGIYGTSYEQVEYDTGTQVVVNEQQPSSNYYKNYFKEKSLEYDNIASGDEIFTDIDAYESDYGVVQDSLENNYQGYAGWGQNNNSVTINYINNGWNNWGWNAGFGWGWNNWRWNRWGWNDPWLWNRGWGWNNGWANIGFYDPFWCPPYYGSSWSYYRPYRYGYRYNSPYHPYSYNRGYYGSRSIAYNTSRRGTVYNRTAIGRTLDRTTTGRTFNRTSTSSTNRRSSTRVLSNRRQNSTVTNRRSGRPNVTRMDRNTSTRLNRSRPSSSSNSGRSYSTSRRSSSSSSGVSSSRSSSSRSSGVSRSSSPSRSSGGSRTRR